MKNSAIIVSGGMDSITLLYDHKDEIALGISFDYGSNHNAREIPFAKMHCERLGIKHITINLDFMHQYFKSSLLDGAEAIPEGHYADDNMKSTVVPFRNGIMLAIAIGIAESNNLDQVFIASPLRRVFSRKTSRMPSQTASTLIVESIRCRFSPTFIPIT